MINKRCAALYEVSSTVFLPLTRAGSVVHVHTFAQDNDTHTPVVSGADPPTSSLLIPAAAAVSSSPACVRRVVVVCRVQECNAASTSAHARAVQRAIV